jgi:uncharacterized protein YceH (UPF0502 family)
MELTAAEGRVLGCLIEQEAVAPDAGPITLNALRLACNQVAGRVPIVAYDDRTVEDTLLALTSRGLARFVPPGKGVRGTRYRHRADERWRMGPAELAVLAVLLLQGAQTVEEVRRRAERLYPFAEPGEVDAVLDTLAARTPRPFAARVPRRPGDYEMRWMQVLTAPVPGTTGEPAAARDVLDQPATNGLPADLASPSYAELVARVADLEQRLAASLERSRRAPELRPEPGPAQGRGRGDRNAVALPPPPPPVDVRPRTVAQLALGPDERRHERGSWSPDEAGAPPAPTALTELERLAGRVGDIERRLARIEAELGALR